MDPISRDDLIQLRDTEESLIKALEKQEQKGSNSVGNINVHVNAGGIGVLIVTGLAAFMAGLCIAMGVMEIHQQKQIDDLHDYLNVVYQYAPQLKPKDFK
jgi:hypothetical protein